MHQQTRNDKKDKIVQPKTSPPDIMHCNFLHSRLVILPSCLLVAQAIVVLVCLIAGLAQTASADQPIDFNRDIRNILATNCLNCHGPDEETREGNLRLDSFDSATGDETDSGDRAIIPGKPDESELIARVVSDEEGYRMPPVESGKKISPAQQKLLHDWIAQGADFPKHWSFSQIRRPELPEIENPEQAVRPFDRFVIARLKKEGLTISDRADRYTLARRISLDLIGLPPSIEQVDAFVNDPSPNAIENYVDKVLANPAYGERWARVWLDLARYADSQGYAQDSARVIWRYRDWVIESINKNMPFDQFTIEQIAGDMLPNPTEDQLIATAFHRNTMTNSEGGTDNEEFRVAAVVDRVNTTMQVWMGITMGCAQCHSHKYDPISQEEFFRVFAILNQTEDADRNDEGPNLAQFTPEQETRRAQLQQQIDLLKETIAKQKKENKQVELAEGPLATKFVRVQQLGEGQFLHLAEVEVFVGEENIAVKGKASQSSTAFDGPAKFGNDGNTDGVFTSKSTTHTNKDSNPWWEVALEKEANIDRVVIWNREDSVANRLRIIGA